MKCRRFIELATLSVLLSCASPARAAGDDGFKAHYEAGLSLYSSEEYEPAIKEFQAAYAIKPKPRLLFNIGQSYRSLGSAREALRFYLLYQALESNPKPGLKAELEGYITQMKAIVAQAERARQAEDRDQTIAGAPPKVEPPRGEPTLPGPPSPPPGDSAAPALRFDAAPPRPVYRRAWFWAVIGGGAAAVLATGLAVGLSMNGGPGYNGDVRHLSF